MKDLQLVAGENISLIRRMKRVTQQDLADDTGLNRAHISAIENGKQNINLSTLEKISKALDVPASTLLSTEDIFEFTHNK